MIGSYKEIEGNGDGIITLDSDRGKPFGFTSDKYEGYLWKKGDTIIISLIETMHSGRGDFSALLKKIEKAGYKIEVPTPSDKMRSILKAKGFRPTIKKDELFGAVEVWCGGLPSK